MTNRIDRLVEAGWVARRHSLVDRRNITIRLTEDGLRLIDLVIGEHLAAERRLLAQLDEDECQLLGRLLRRLGCSVRAAG